MVDGGTTGHPSWWSVQSAFGGGGPLDLFGHECPSIRRSKCFSRALLAAIAGVVLMPRLDLAVEVSAGGGRCLFLWWRSQGQRWQSRLLLPPMSTGATRPWGRSAEQLRTAPASTRTSSLALRIRLGSQPPARTSTGAT